MSGRHARQPRVLAGGFGFIEGPRWHDAALWFSDVYTHRVYRLVPGREPSVVCQVPGQPSGIGFDASGAMLVVSMLDRRILRLVDGHLIEHADLSQVVRASLNDMVVGRDGAAYVGNLGGDPAAETGVAPTRLILVEPDGSARCVGDGLLFPNGAVITADRSTLVVAESFACRLTAFSIAPDGELRDRHVWAQLGPAPAPPSYQAALAGQGPVPDGIALDSEGAIWVADASGGALRIAPGGEVLERVDVPGFCVFAVALGGPRLRTLYLCTAPTQRKREDRRAQLMACDVSAAGVVG